MVDAVAPVHPLVAQHQAVDGVPRVEDRSGGAHLGVVSPVDVALVALQHPRGVLQDPQPRLHRSKVIVCHPTLAICPLRVYDQSLKGATVHPFSRIIPRIERLKFKRLKTQLKDKQLRMLRSLG